MRKGVKITVSVIAAAVIISGVWYICSPQKGTEQPGDNVPAENTSSEVKVDINKTQESIPIYEEITDEETGEKVIAEVQENAPPEEKPTVPPEKPKSNDSYTNPEKPPEYKKEQTTVEKKPEKKETKEAAPTKKSGNQVYIEGFGYVPQGAETQNITGNSNGDINKQVGTMD